MAKQVVSSVKGLVKYFLPVKIPKFFGKSVKFGKIQYY